MLQTSSLFLVEAMTRLLTLRDIETAEHTKRVATLYLELARASGRFTATELLMDYHGALLHDIGKIGIPDAILQKPGALTNTEMETIKTHPAHAYEWLHATPGFEILLDIPYCHHEKWDGTGYPRGLKGQEIPFSARLFAVVDVWDALTSDRCYRPAWPADRAYHYILSQSGTFFDPDVVELFVQHFHPADIQVDMRKLLMHPVAA